ncbi:hypothetical protein COOONC_18895 [Cooperia oncophora]
MKMFTEWNPVKGYIIMEYLENLKAVHLYETVTPQEVKQVLRFFDKAAMEASSLDVPSEERNEYISPFKTIFAAVFNEEMVDRLLTVFSTFEGGKFKESGKHLKEIFPDLVDVERVENMSHELRNGRSFMSRRFMVHERFVETKRRCSQHGRCCGLSGSSSDSCKANGPLWLRSNRSCAGALCLSQAARIGQAHWEELLEEFYGYLREEVGNRKMPYTLEQLKEAYRQYFPMGAFMIVPMVGPFFEMVCKSTDEEIKKKRMQVVMEKTERVLDDMFSLHERNMKLRKREKGAKK